MKRVLLVSFGLMLSAAYVGCLPADMGGTGTGGSTGTPGEDCAFKGKATTRALVRYDTAREMIEAPMERGGRSDEKTMWLSAPHAVVVAPRWYSPLYLSIGASIISRSHC